METSPPLNDIVLRILAATVAGALVGLERESRGRPAGLRTTILTCVAAAVAMILSEHLFHQTSGGSGWRPDPARLGAGILTGIGFLGAGTILRQENVIRGVTTAATLWFMTVSGLAFGAGLFALGFVSVAVGLLTLYALPFFEKHIPSNRYANLTLISDVEVLNEEQFEQDLEKHGFTVRRTELSYDLAARRKTISYELKADERTIREQSHVAIENIRKVPGVLKISWT
jgi:putative Mg2+ transporter-C (MgtC) family protein